MLVVFLSLALSDLFDFLNLFFFHVITLSVPASASVLPWVLSRGRSSTTFMTIISAFLSVLSKSIVLSLSCSVIRLCFFYCFLVCFTVDTKLFVKCNLFFINVVQRVVLTFGHKGHALLLIFASGNVKKKFLFFKSVARVERATGQLLFKRIKSLWSLLHAWFKKVALKIAILYCCLKMFNVIESE